MSLNKIIVNEEVFFFQDLTDFMYNDLFCFGGFMWEELATRFDLNKLTPTVPEGLWSLLWKSFEGQNNCLNFLFSVQLV